MFKRKNKKASSFISDILKGFSSIGEGISTFSIWPNSSEKDYLKDIKKYLEKSKKYSEKYGVQNKDFNFTPGIKPYNDEYFKEKK